MSVIASEPRSQWLYEGLVKDRLSWTNLLGCSAEQIDQLLSQNVLQRSAASRGNLRLNLVGLLSTPDAVFFSFPKIFQGVEFDPNECMHNVIHVIERYHSKFLRSNAASTADPAEMHIEGRSIVDHFLGLINWTREHGFHSACENSFSERGVIDWRRTLGTQLALHQGQNVTYVDTVRTAQIEVATIISAIQASAIVDLSRRIGSNLASIWIGENDPIIEQSLDILSNLELKLDRRDVREAIQNFNETVTQDHERDLGQMLERWENNKFQTGPNLQVYGFTAFHTVWEEMCASLWGPNVTLVAHFEIASQPEYMLNGHSVNVPSQRPDAIVSTDQGITIADAKWYRVDHGEVPALHDIIKQFAYGLSVQTDVNIGDNIFLVPSSETIEYDHFGMVEMKYQSNLDTRFPPIRVIRVGWAYAVSCYLGSKREANFLGPSSTVASSGLSHASA